MSEYLTWRVGDEVFCLKTFKEVYFEVGERGPEGGKVYTIRELIAEDDGEIYIRLKEIVNPKTCDILKPGMAGVECCRKADNFRKVKKTNIDVFKAMLNKTPAQNNKELVESEMKTVMEEV